MKTHIISQNISILQALKVLNNLSGDVLTLFVVDEEERMVGTLSDGDIRRKLITGISLDAPVSQVMNYSFSFITETEVNCVDVFCKLKKKRITLVPMLDKERHIVKIFNLMKYRSILPVDAVLMAGGKGERLRPLTDNTPKPLLPVGDKTIIDYNIERLISYGIDHISVTVNYLKEQLEEHFKETKNEVKIQCVREPKYLGTIGSIKFVEMFYNETILLMNSDLFTNIDYEDFYLNFRSSKADMSVAAIPYTVSVPYGVFELDGLDIHGITEKPTYNYYANAGIYLIKKELLNLIPDDTFYNATDFMEMLIRKNMKVVRFPITGYWIDIGKHEEYKKAQELVKHL